MSVLTNELTHLIFLTTLRGRDHPPHLIDEETEAQRGYGNHLKSHYYKARNLDLNVGKSGPGK